MTPPTLRCRCLQVENNGVDHLATTRRQGAGDPEEGDTLEVVDADLGEELTPVAGDPEVVEVDFDHHRSLIVRGVRGEGIAGE